jgi:hypothetical protein
MPGLNRHVGPPTKKKSRICLRDKRHRNDEGIRKKTRGIFFFWYEGREKIKIRLFHVESEEEYIYQLDV